MVIEDTVSQARPFPLEEDSRFQSSLGKGEIGSSHLDSPTLMMHIVKRSVLLAQPLQRVPWHAITTVVVDTFHDRNGGEADDLTGGKTREHQRKSGADCIEDECFGKGIVKSAECIGDIDTVVVGMDVAFGKRKPKSVKNEQSFWCKTWRYLKFRGAEKE